MKHLRIRFTLWLIMAVVISGCAAKTESRQKVLFPPPPEEPRYEWLGTIRTPSDFEGRKESFSALMVGADTSDVFSGPLAVVSTSDGRILVGDLYRKQITSVDMETGLIDTFSKNVFNSNNGLAVDAQDRVYVAETFLGMVLVFSGSGQPLYVIGDKSTLEKPSGVAVNDRLGRLYVSDGAGSIKVFSLEGEFLFQFGQQGSGEGELYYPQGMAIDSEDRLFVADTLNARIQVFSADGEFENQFGQRGTKIGEFEMPKDLAFDSEGNLYVVDARRPNLRVFTPEGQVLLMLGSNQRSGHPLGFTLPLGVFVDSRDRVMIADLMNRTLTVWQFLSETYKAGKVAQGTEND